MNKLFGLIGYPLTHSFSKKYFTEKFVAHKLTDHRYELFEISEVAKVKEIIDSNPDLVGLNVTIPYKESILPYLDSLDATAELIGAVNVISLVDGRLIGFNSDHYGFRSSLLNWTGEKTIRSAIVLGTGGASKAIITALGELNIDYVLISSTKKKGAISYDEMNSSGLLGQTDLVVNTTPLGMYPSIDATPNIDFEQLNENHYCFDLIYNPPKTQFLQRAENRGAQIKNGIEMLELQAEKSWEIWHS